MRNDLDSEALGHRRDEIREELASVGDLRPGSLVGRYRKCGKPNCHCATDDGGGHGPSWSLTRQVGGKTVTRIIPASAVERTREQIAEYQRFKKLAGELVEVSEAICETILTDAADGTGEGLKKGASKRSSTPRLSPRSERS